MPVAFDLSANARKQRGWFRHLFEQTDAENELHFGAALDDPCRRQLRQRSEQRGPSPGTKWTTDADFDDVTAHFQQSCLCCQSQR